MRTNTPTPSRDVQFDCIAFGRLVEAIRRVAADRGICGDPLADVSVIGSFNQQLTAVAIWSELPKSFKKHKAAWSMALAVVLSAGSNQPHSAIERERRAAL